MSSTRLSLSNLAGAPELLLKQLVSVRNLVNQSLDIVDVSTWTGDPLDARFIFSQLHLLHETIAEARQMLKGESDVIRGKWEENSAGENVSLPCRQRPYHWLLVLATVLRPNYEDI